MGPLTAWRRGRRAGAGLAVALLALGGPPVVAAATHPARSGPRSPGRRVPSADAAPGLGLRLSARHLGYVSATLTGPPGTPVTLVEADRAAHGEVASVVIGGDGTVRLARALTDLCTVRIRTLRAQATLAGQTLRADATLVTPACSTRLAVEVPTHARIASGVAVTVRDRWRIGDVAVTVCVQPPGGDRGCHTRTLAAGRVSARIPVALPRVGGWLISTSIPGGRPHQTIVWAGHPGPIRLLALGDSEMQVLDDDIARTLAPDGVTVTSLARPSTGLTNPQLLNWQNTARRLVARVRPDISIVAMGANDAYPVAHDGRQVACCGAAWSAGYGQLVARMARTLLRGQAASADWFVLATPRPPAFQQVFDGVNAGIRDAAAQLGGRLGLIDANAFFTPHNRYRNAMTLNGQSFVIHEPDGIHLDATADGFAAGLVLAQLRADRIIR